MQHHHLLLSFFLFCWICIGSGHAQQQQEEEKERDLRAVGSVDLNSLKLTTQTVTHIVLTQFTLTYAAASSTNNKNNKPPSVQQRKKLVQALQYYYSDLLDASPDSRSALLSTNLLRGSSRPTTNSPPLRTLDLELTGSEFIMNDNTLVLNVTIKLNVPLRDVTTSNIPNADVLATMLVDQTDYKYLIDTIVRPSAGGRPFQNIIRIQLSAKGILYGNEIGSDGPKENQLVLDYNQNNRPNNVLEMTSGMKDGGSALRTNIRDNLIRDGGN